MRADVARTPGLSSRGTAAVSAALLGSLLLWSAGELHAAVKLPRDDLQSVVRAATDAQAFRFPRTGDFLRNRAIATVGMEAGKRITGDVLQRLRDAIFSDQSYDVRSGAVTSCAFYPRLGFRFASGGREAWWLVSDSCAAGILVERNDPWGKARTLNLTAEAVRNFVQWAEGPGNGG
jgi:hypothetical protein